MEATCRSGANLKIWRQANTERSLNCQIPVQKIKQGLALERHADKMPYS